MDYFAKRIIIIIGHQLSIAHLTTLPLRQLQQLAHVSSHIGKD